MIRAILPTIPVNLLVEIVCETADPYWQHFAPIMENTEENLDAVGDYHGTEWILRASKNGRWNEDDKYFCYLDDGTEIYSFSTTDELIKHIGEDCIVDTISDCEDDCEIIGKTLTECGRKLCENISKEVDGKAPCEIKGFEL